MVVPCRAGPLLHPGPRNQGLHPHPSPPLQCPHSHLWACIPVLFATATENLLLCTHTSSQPEGLPTPQHLPAGKSQRASGPRLLGTQPVHEHSGQRKDDMRAELRARPVAPWTVTQGQVDQERTGQQAALSQLPISRWPRPCGSPLLDSAGKSSLQLVVFLCSCAVEGD